MNKELGMLVIVRHKKVTHQAGKSHKIFLNLIGQNFTSDEINKKGCTDFSCLYLTNGCTHYSCSIIDLHGRSIVASITDKQMTSDLAIRILKKL